MERRRIGIIGFGHIGQYLYEAISKSKYLEVAFVWNRTPDKLAEVPKDLVLKKLKDFEDYNVDLIIEVAHVSITTEYGEKFLEKTNFFIGSPTILADAELENKLRHKAITTGHSLYVPAGAFWGGEDIAKMARLGTLKSLKVTMKKHPSSFKVLGDLAEKNSCVGEEPVVLYEGPVRQLCPMAPANVNTMACAAIAASNLGFDGVQGCLIADKSLDCHIVEIELTGPGTDGDNFTVKTTRRNPCKLGAVTGNATYASFFASLENAHGKGGGIHLC